jgi:hypothetical protein
VLALRIVADVLAWHLPTPGVPGRSGRRMRAVWTTVAALALVGLSLHVAIQRRVHRGDLTAVLRHLERVPLPAGSVAVALHPSPVLRYLCEYGPFVGRLPPPVAFRLSYVGGPEPLIRPETRYLLTYEDPGTLARAYPRIGFRTDPAWPTTLYAVDPAGR